MNNKQIVIYGVLESTNDLRSVFVGHIHFQKLSKNFTIAWNIEIFHYCMTRAQEQEIRFLLIIFIHKNHFKKGKYETTLFSENFWIIQFQWDILLQHDQTQKIWDRVCLRNTQNFEISINILLWQNQIKFRNTNLDVFMRCQSHKNYFRKEKHGTESF